MPRGVAFPAEDLPPSVSAERTFRAGFLFCGLGAGARGFLEARAHLGPDAARFVNVGGIDNDPDACADFARLAGATAVCADVGQMTPAALRTAWGDRAPDCVFLSPPCKGFSGLLSAERAQKPEYQALNLLVLQGIFLLVETWPVPPATIVLENVPRIVSRGRVLLEQVCELLVRYGYRFDKNQHDCGEIGGLAQHRRRFLLVARRLEAVPAFIYRPPRLRVRGCGEVLGLLHLPEDPGAGMLHRLPRLSWLTWVRLALIPAGGDWRDLPGVVEPGRQRRAVWARYDVRAWDQAARTVAGDGSNGGFGVADPRGQFAADRHRNKFRVLDWQEASTTVIGASRPGSGALSVADPRIREWNPGVMGVRRWSDPSCTVTGAAAATRGAFSVADPRIAEAVALKQTAKGAASFKGRPGLLGVADWSEPTSAITGSASPTGSNGIAAVADPRIALGCEPRAGAYGVVPWDAAAAAVTGSAGVDNGPFSVADPRDVPAEPPIIRAPDGTWHRPMTTLDLAALQGLPATLDGEPLRLAGRSHAKWRERIGNAVPVGAGQAIAESILLALLAGALGTWTLGSTGIWVRRDGRSEHEWSAEA